MDIDISDEASTFKPTLVSREEKTAPETQETQEVQEVQEEPESETDFAPESQQEFEEPEHPTEESTEEQVEPEAESFRRPGYREAYMTDGLFVEQLIEEIDNMAENRSSDLGQVVHVWEHA